MTEEIGLQTRSSGRFEFSTGSDQALLLYHKRLIAKTKTTSLPSLQTVPHAGSQAAPSARGRSVEGAASELATVLRSSNEVNELR